MRSAIRRLCAALALSLSLAAPATALANTSLGPHLGFNFDVDDPFLGIGARFGIGGISHSVQVDLNPTFSYYFTDDVDLLNFSFNVPFEFVIGGSVLRPFAAPGLGIYHRSTGGGSDTDLTLNLIGGLLFQLRVVEPFLQLKVAIGDSSTAELIGGLLFVL